MEPWTSGAWVVWLSLCMGVGAYILSMVVVTWYRGTTIPKQHAEYVEELDRSLRELQQSEIYRAICYRRVADLIGKMPADFDPVAVAGMQASETMGRAILSHAEEVGLYPAGTFERLGVAPQELPPAQSKPNGNGGEALPWIGRFVRGRLVPPSPADPPPPPN